MAIAVVRNRKGDGVTIGRSSKYARRGVLVGVGRSAGTASGARGGEVLIYVPSSYCFCILLSKIANLSFHVLFGMNNSVDDNLVSRKFIYDFITPNFYETIVSIFF